MPRPSRLSLVVANLLLLLNQSECNYDVCYDSISRAPLACQPSIQDVIQGGNVQVTLSPPDSTCGSPVSFWQRIGDRSAKVETCDANLPSLRHPPEYMIDRNRTTWWQSTNQSPQTTQHPITVTLSFNKMFRLSGDIIITFYSGRPNKMVLEKSTDFGVTWSALQFYARRCSDFPQTSGVVITKTNPTAVVCVNRFVETSLRTVPGRKVEFNVQGDRFDLFPSEPTKMFKNVYVAIDTLMLDFLLFTNLRIRLIETAVDSGGNYDKYNYGISRIQAVGRCYCSLHASHCNYTGPDVVCDCKHNTQGKNCESCLPLYNERPWQRGHFVPYGLGTAHECQKCECNEHAISCTFNVVLGGGICDVCMHNTRGNHCELCTLGFYPNVSLPLSALDKCVDCDCEDIGVTNVTLPCDQSITPGIIHGQCPCKPDITGRRCDQCLVGFYGLFLDPLGTCQSCGCDLDGTLGQSNVCAQEDGECPCKPSTVGKICDQCADGYYSFPRGTPQRGCFPCNCDKGGSLSQVCDMSTGKCQCRSGVGGDTCDQTQPGSYVPAIDILTLQPQANQGAGSCTVTSDLWTPSNPFDGTVFAVCPVTSGVGTSLTFDTLTGGMMQNDIQWPYYAAVRYTSTVFNITSTLSVQVMGSSQADLTPLSTRLGQHIPFGCPVSNGILTQINLITFSAGVSTAVLSTDRDLIILDYRCQYSFTLQLNKPAPSNGAGTTLRKKRALSPSGEQIRIDSLVMLPALVNTDGSVAYQVYSTSENTNDTKDTYYECLNKVANLRSRDSSLTDLSCGKLFFTIGSEMYGGARACACNDIGSLLTSTCRGLGGQCLCRTGVMGRTCNVCRPGHYNFTETGCTPCNCHPTGSETGACDVNTGQCPCLNDVAQVTTSVVDAQGQAQTPFDGTCSQCLPNYYGIQTGLGCTVCDCNADGSQLLQCDSTGLCPCKESVMGDKCDACKEGFYGFSPTGCSACNCTAAGSQSLNCQAKTGHCTCKSNVVGDKCSDCLENFFNLEQDNPKGCQPCFCFKHGTNCDSATGFRQTNVEISDTQIEDFTALYGDQHISYGRALTMNLIASFILDIDKEVVITLENNKKKIQHVARNDTVINRSSGLQYQVRLWEDEWFFVDDTQTQTATAQNIYDVLVNIDEVWPITVSNGQAVKMTHLSLESAQMINSMDVSATVENATFVEDCTCLPSDNVGGLSCEICATGFKRQNPLTATSFDTCVACDCTGRGSTDPPECDQMTGICLNCRNGTTGDQCDSCAANVTGTECDQCVPEFWGLDTSGCKGCDCSSPGSTNNMCDATTGQCTCVDHVVGRMCDQCEENYQDLTSTGCTNCDSCYDEVAKVIGPLRSLQDFIVSNTTIVEIQDTTVVNGLFTVRLAAATTDTTKLVNFLTSAVESEVEVLTQINSLTSSLKQVMDQLTVIEQNTTSEIESMLAETETYLDEATAKRTSMEAFTKTVFTNLASIQPQTSRLSDLVSSLRGVEKYLQGQADSSTSDLKLIQDLNQLNTTTFTANMLANQASTSAASLMSIHQNTTSKLLVLERLIISVSNKAAEVLAKANLLSVSRQGVQANAEKLQKQLADLMGYTVDVAPFTTRRQNVFKTTDAYKSQLAAELALFGPTNLNALKTMETSESLGNQTRDLTTDAATWLRRSTAADQRSLNLKAQSDIVFTTADKTLKTVNNFATLSHDAKALADVSLNKVTSIHEASKQLIAESQQLTISIASLQQLASSAKQTSQQALQLIKEKQQQLQGVLVQAEQLEVRLKNEVDLSSERYKIMNNTKENIVTPATEQSEQLFQAVNAYETILASTDNTTTNALTQTAAVKERANKILIQLRAIDTVDTSVAQQLLSQVQTAVTTTNVASLKLAVQELETAKDVQRAEIDRLKALKENIRTRIQNLQFVMNQLS